MSILRLYFALIVIIAFFFCINIYLENKLMFASDVDYEGLRFSWEKDKE